MHTGERVTMVTGMLIKVSTTQPALIKCANCFNSTKSTNINALAATFCGVAFTLLQLCNLINVYRSVFLLNECYTWVKFKLYRLIFKSVWHGCSVPENVLSCPIFAYFIFVIVLSVICRFLHFCAWHIISLIVYSHEIPFCGWMNFL